MSTYILWDIDGTLIYNTPSAGALYLDAVEHVTGVRPTVPVPEPHGMTEGQLLLAILEVNELDTSRLGDVLYDLDVLSREEHERGLVRDACVGADAALRAVAERGWVNALLTGNGPNRARYKLLAAGYDPEAFDWDHSYFGHESPTRHHLTAGARSALSGHDAVIIGDTPNDGLAADSARIPFVAVATGIYSADHLRATSALVVADDLDSGLDAILGAIESVATTAADEIGIEEFGESPDVEVSTAVDTAAEPEGSSAE
jgi:phosphoglycolate phosphatase-like HAD superfamily hydrolase